MTCTCALFNHSCQRGVLRYQCCSGFLKPLDGTPVSRDPPQAPRVNVPTSLKSSNKARNVEGESFTADKTMLGTIASSRSATGLQDAGHHDIFGWTGCDFEGAEVHFYIHLTAGVWRQHLTELGLNALHLSLDRLQSAVRSLLSALCLTPGRFSTQGCPPGISCLISHARL